MVSGLPMSSTLMHTPATPSAPRVSLLTPAGVGAIAVIRLEGRGADRLIEQVFHPHDRSAGGLAPDRIRYGELRHAHESIDDVLVVPAADTGASRSGGPTATRSFDICAHGGLRVVERIVVALTEAGASFVGCEEARGSPWVGTNTIEREVWEALVVARTRRAVRFLTRQRTALPAELRRIARTAARDAEAAVAALRKLLEPWPGCRFLIEGGAVAISGAPNAGKSTLANRLGGAERSLVSPRPGTTLDWVAQETAIAGVPVKLIDTPGYGHPGGALDHIAAQRARERAAVADLHLRVFDGSEPPPAEDGAWSATGVPTLLVLNKSDLGSVWAPAQIEAQRCNLTVRVSAASGANMGGLVREIGRMLGVEWADEEGVIGLFTERQTGLVREIAGKRRVSRLSEMILTELIGEVA